MNYIRHKKVLGDRTYYYFRVEDENGKVRRSHAFYHSVTAMEEAIVRETRRDLEEAYRAQNPDTIDAAEWDKFLSIMNKSPDTKIERKMHYYDPSDKEWKDN